VGAEVWVLGGTGRSGRAVAVELVARGLEPVLVGRDAERLQAAAGAVGADQVLVASSVEEMAALVGQHRPAVVVNTVGPFATTAPPLLAACLPGSHYVDLANDLGAVVALLEQDAAAVAAGRTVVTGAGFGVTATESVVVALCAGRPAPARVRVDMVPSLAVEEGVLGDALAGTLVEGLPGVPGGRRFQGRAVRGGRLVPARLGGDALLLTLPDGERVTTAALPLGELLAAQRASGAAEVVAASSAGPTSPLARAVLPLGTALLGVAPLRAAARRGLARVRFRAAPRPREHSYGHARVEWADGSVREGWLQLGDAQEWTGAVPAEISRRLLAGEGRAGAGTPAALFGTSLAQACGATYLLDA